MSIHGYIVLLSLVPTLLGRNGSTVIPHVQGVKPNLGKTALLLQLRELFHHRRVVRRIGEGQGRTTRSIKHRGTQRRSSKVAAGVVAAALLLPGIALAPSAAAATGDLKYGYVTNGLLGTGIAHLGSLSSPTSNGGVMWCIEFGKGAPTQTQMNSASSSPLERSRLAYLYARYESSPASSTTGSMSVVHTMKDTHAAISYLTHFYYDVNEWRRAEVKTWTTKNLPKIKTLADALWAEAGLYDGPYEAVAGLDLEVKDGVAQGEARARVANSSRNVPGFPGTLTLSGPATFSNGSKAVSFTSGTSAVRYPIKVTGPGKVTASASYSQMPNYRVRTVNAGTNVQKVYVQGGRQAASASASATQRTSTLAVSTVASSTYVGPTTSLIKDQITLNGPSDLAGLVGTVTAQAYYAGTAKPAERAGTAGGTAIAVGAPITTTVMYNANGNAYADVQVAAARGAGWYTWVVSTPATLGGIVPATTSRFGIPSETVQIIQQPQIRTTAEFEQLDINAGTARSRDTVTITNLNPGQVITATLRPYAPLASIPVPAVQSVPASAVSKALPAITLTLTADAKGEAKGTSAWVSLPPAVVGDTSWGTWVVSIPAVAGVSAAYTSPFGVASESGSWRREQPGAPLVSSQVSAQRAEPGDTISETLLVDPNGAELDLDPLVITSYLWHTTSDVVPGSPLPADAVMVGSEVLAPINTMDPLNPPVVSGVNPYTIPTGAAHKGNYVYTYSYAATPGYPEVIDHTVYASEVSFVPWQPQLETTTSHARAEVGDQIHDTQIITEGRPFSEVTVATDLYGPYVSIPVRAPAPPVGDVPLFTTSHTVTLDANGRGTLNTAPYVLTERGAHTWVGHIVGTLEWDEFTSDFGITEETTLVPYQPTVTTVTSHEVATVGTELTDAFEVANQQPGAVFDVVHSLWVVPPGIPVVEVDGIPAHAVLQGVVTSTVTADATGTISGTSPGVVVKDVGTSVWTETITPGPADLFTAWTSRFGIASESGDVVAVTTTAQPLVAVGGVAVDTAHVSGNVPGGAKLVFEVYRHSGTSDVADDVKFATTAAVDVTGPGDFDSPGVVIEELNDIYWVELLLDANGNLIHRGEPRLPNETTRTVQVKTKATGTVLGGAIYDVATVEGTPAAGEYLIFRAYDLPEGMSPEDVTPESLGAVFTSEKIPVVAAGDVKGQDWIPKVAKAYYWSETYYDADGHPVHTGVIGAPGETSMVTPPGTPPPGEDKDKPSPTPTKPSPRTPDEELAITGATVVWVAVGAAALLGGGVAAVAVSRRRRESDVTSI